MDHEQARRIVLIDDDRLFGRGLMELGRRRGLDIEYFESLTDLGFVGGLAAYSAAVVDYHLESMTGKDIARYLETLLGGIPMVLISSDEAAGSQELPRCVHRFVNKSAGLSTIIDAVAELPLRRPPMASLRSKNAHPVPIWPTARRG